MNNSIRSRYGCDYFDYNVLECAIQDLKSRYGFLKFDTVGSSILGRRISMISFGKGKRSIIYIGGHHGMEWITSALLAQFVWDFCEEFTRSDRVFDVSTRLLFETRTIHVIPMLNPDGIDYSIHGVSENNILRERLLRMNGGSDDFSRWQANARGVDLNHNYACGFQEYKIMESKLNIPCGAPTKYSGECSESEPETRALCNFVRLAMPELALSFHTQGEEIYYTSGEKTAASSLSIAKTISRLTGYKISFPSGSAKYGGFTDWFIDEFDKPSFTLECGLGKNPLPYSQFEDIYPRLKRSLFTIPILI